MGERSQRGNMGEKAVTAIQVMGRVCGAGLGFWGLRGPRDGQYDMFKLTLNP